MFLIEPIFFKDQHQAWYTTSGCQATINCERRKKKEKDSPAPLAVF